jgi:putative transposase
MTTYFITACAHMKQNLFQRDQVAELMVTTFFRYRDAGEFELHEYVVMPNHIHLLLSIKPDQELSRVMQVIKGGFSHSLRQHGIVFRAVWEQRYYDRRVRDANEFAEFTHYIRQNPVRKGLAERPEEYPYSAFGVSGLKPLEIKKGDIDANLKVRSTDFSQGGDANLKVRSTDFSQGGGANLKVRSTDFSQGGGANLKVRSTDSSQGGGANLKVRSTDFSQGGGANLKVRSTVQELTHV